MARPMPRPAPVTIATLPAIIPCVIPIAFTAAQRRANIHVHFSGDKSSRPSMALGPPRPDRRTHERRGGKLMNAINVIAPYRHHRMWGFYDPPVVLVQE